MFNQAAILCKEKLDVAHHWAIPGFDVLVGCLLLLDIPFIKPNIRIQCKVVKKLSVLVIYVLLSLPESSLG